MTEGERHPHSPKTDACDGVKFSHHIVAVIDFLGQAAELAKWDSLPTTPQEEASFLVAVRGTFGRIMVWREEFEKNFNMWLSVNQPPDWVADVAPDGGDALKEFQETSIGFSHFSDTIVVYSPIENRHGHLSLGGTCGVIVTCGTLMLAALNQKTVFRGGIEIGMAGCFAQADIYGPALAKAHYLESKVADYPRIVVGPILVSYLQTHATNPENTREARVNRGTASFCLRLLTRDPDGCWIIDYLGDEFCQLGTNPDGWQKLRSDAHSFVDAEYTRFAQEGNEKLAQRYERLQAYFHLRGFPPAAAM